MIALFVQRICTSRSFIHFGTWQRTSKRVKLSYLHYLYVVPKSHYNWLCNNLCYIILATSFSYALSISQRFAGTTGTISVARIVWLFEVTYWKMQTHFTIFSLQNIYQQLASSTGFSFNQLYLFLIYKILINCIILSRYIILPLQIKINKYPNFSKSRKIISNLNDISQLQKKTVQNYNPNLAIFIKSGSRFTCI